MLQPNDPAEDERAYLMQQGAFTYDPKLSVAYTRGLYKTAALFFDRIYLDWFDYVTLRYALGQTMPVDALFFDDRITGGISRYMTPGFSSMFATPDPVEEMHAYTVGVMELARENGFKFVPIYGTLHSGEPKTPITKDQQASTVELALTCFPMVQERLLDWEQVDEFRSDIESIGGFRSVRNLLSDVAKCKSTLEATDVIESRMEKYKSSCNKHGLKLVQSSFNLVSKKDTVLSAIAAGAVTGDIVTGATLGGLKLASDMTLNLIESVRDRRALSADHMTGALAIQLKDLEKKISS